MDGGMTVKRINNQNVWVVIPAYNEEETLGDVLSDLAKHEYNVVVIDDGSTDATAEIVLQYSVVLLRHLINLGQGAALQTGIDFILQYKNALAIVTFDADGQHCPSDIENLLEPLINDHADVTLGTRFGQGSKPENLPTIRRMILKLAVIFTRITTGLKVSDTHNGLRAFSISAAQKIEINQNRMAHASELLSQISKQKMRYVEVPVRVKYTEYSKKKGQSIFGLINILWDIISEGLR